MMTETNITGPDETPWAEIASYVSDQMTADIRAAFECRLDNDPELRATTERVRGAMGAWEPVDGAALEMSRERMWVKVKSRARRQGQDLKVGLRGGRREVGWVGSRTLRRLGWSSGFVLAALVAVMFGRLGQNGVEITRTYKTRTGQQATLTLVDGTQVTLAPQSTIRLTRFGGQLRTVMLDGEAYFEVSHVSGAPFLVQSGSVTTRVLGTAFLVRHYAGETRVRVAVADGKVNVTGRALPSPGLPLVAGHIGDISDSTVHVSTVEDLSPETDWMRGKLIFRDAPVAEVLATLSRWYGFHFRCADSTLAQQNITAGLSTQSSTAALATLEQVLGVSLAVRGDTITLTPNAGHSNHGSSRKRLYDVWTPISEVGR